MDKETTYRLALSLMPQVGALKAKSLISHFESASAIFQSDENQLLAGGVSASLAKKLSSKPLQEKCLARTKKEISFIEKKKIEVLHFDDSTYPAHLKDCEDSPLLIFKKGIHSLNYKKSVAIVGTRNATSYGRDFTDKLVKHLAQHQATIVSGLAYGIDAQTHQSCLKYHTPTIGVLGHGLDMMYPSVHRKLAAQMTKQGAVITEFLSETKSLPGNFPKRNRIVAGMVDAVIVVEGAIKGGAMVTANLAHGYQKELFAVPGRSTDKYSQGCNHLIKTQRAMLLDDPEELAMELGWESFDLEKKFKKNDYNLDPSLSELEKNVVKTLLDVEAASKEELCKKLTRSLGDLSPILFELELNNYIKSLPGSKYALIK